MCLELCTLRNSADNSGLSFQERLQIRPITQNSWPSHCTMVMHFTAEWWSLIPISISIPLGSSHGKVYNRYLPTLLVVATESEQQHLLNNFTDSRCQLFQQVPSSSVTDLHNFLVQLQDRINTLIVCNQEFSIVPVYPRHFRSLYCTMYTQVVSNVGEWSC